jgi:hypothetical protein
LEKGRTFSSAFLQIKAFFWGGPEIYPLLEEIKIFVELAI